MDKPILSICIPTYNRASFLRQALDSIIFQFKDEQVKDLVEVVISDNASSDNTSLVVAEFQAKFSNIHYFKNPENLGVDKNILSLGEKATGEYIWLFGDDDAFFNDSIKAVLDEIQKSRTPYYLANSYGYDHELKEPVLSHPNLPYNQNQYFNKLSDFVRSIKDYGNLVGYFGGCSCQIFSRQKWQDFPTKNEFIGSQTIHLHVLLSAMKELPFTILSKPLIKTRCDNIRWDTFPGLETAHKRREQTKKGLFWIKDLYNLPISLWRVEWLFFKQKIEGSLVVFFKQYIFKTPTLKKFAGKIYKLVFRK